VIKLTMSDKKEDYIISLNYPKLHLIKQIPIEIMKEGKAWIATCNILNGEWGTSINSEHDAIKILIANLVELYYFLKQNQNNLGSWMEEVWKKMQEYIREI